MLENLSVCCELTVTEGLLQNEVLVAEERAYEDFKVEEEGENELKMKDLAYGFVNPLTENEKDVVLIFVKEELHGEEGLKI